jgi:hypothetical protein
LNTEIDTPTAASSAEPDNSKIVGI